jgi:hypothetical protein
LQEQLGNKIAVVADFSLEATNRGSRSVGCTRPGRLVARLVGHHGNGDNIRIFIHGTGCGIDSKSDDNRRE